MFCNNNNKNKEFKNKDPQALFKNNGSLPMLF